VLYVFKIPEVKTGAFQIFTLLYYALMHLAASIVFTYGEIFASGLMHNPGLRKFGMHP
jgi:hypothetical protein